MLKTFQVPEFIQGYIGLVDVEVLQWAGLFVLFLMLLLVIRSVRKLTDKVTATMESMQQFRTSEQDRALREMNRRQAAPDGGRAPNPAGTDLKLAVLETELKALKDMVVELRKSRDDWKAQAERASRWQAPSIPGSAPAETPPAPQA